MSSTAEEPPSGEATLPLAQPQRAKTATAKAHIVPTDADREEVCMVKDAPTREGALRTGGRSSGGAGAMPSSPKRGTFILGNQIFILGNKLSVPQGQKLVPERQMLAHQGQKLVPERQMLAHQGQNLVPERQMLAHQGQRLVPARQMLAHQGQRLVPERQMLAHQGQTASLAACIDRHAGAWAALRALACLLAGRLDHVPMAMDTLRATGRLATAVFFSVVAWRCQPAPAVLDAGVVHPELGMFDRQPGQTYFCDLPIPDLPLAGLPDGFCVRMYASGVASARVMAFAPNGDLFVTAPSVQVPGLAPPGLGQIVVLPDDNHDGLADGTVVFLAGLPTVHGLLFAGGYLYYTVDHAVFRVAYTQGARTYAGPPPEQVADLAAITPPNGRWTHTLAQAQDGTVYVSVGEYSSYTCPPGPRTGVVATIAPGAAPTVVAGGFRNPLFLRCDPAGTRCYAAELSDDGWDPATGVQGREKLVLLRQGDSYGYPCCAGAGASAPPGRAAGMTDCAITAELHAWALHDTPFGMTFEQGHFPAPWRNGFFVGLHGQFLSWQNTKVVWSPVDANGQPTGVWHDFLTGWGSSRFGIHGRITDVSFAPDGRLFVTDDEGGKVYWIAHETQAVPSNGSP